MTDTSSNSPSDPGAIDVNAFAKQFQTFLETMDHYATEASRDHIASELHSHLGTDPRSIEPVRQEYARWQWAEIDAALDSLADDQDLRGVIPAHDASGLSDLLTNHYNVYELGAIERRAFPTGPETVRYVATNGLRLLWIGEKPVIALALEVEDGPSDTHKIVVEVMCEDHELARETLAGIDQSVRAKSVIYGQVVSFLPEEFGSEAFSIEFHPRPHIEAQDVVLPKGRLEKIEATVLGISEKADRLRAAGQHLSRGVLLYGPPGTGKTLTIRYLLSQARDTTAILLQGEALSKIRAAASAARAIGRAIIVLEDADLVAEDRDFNEGERSVLFEILDVLDGLGDDADISFVLTTNRVDVLEEAIAMRPGRIDLAVEVPLPSTKLRRRLFAVYGNDFAFTEEGIAKAAKAAEGTSGSFAKEAVRRAVLLAIEAEEDPNDNHLLEAVAALTAEATQLREAMTSNEEWDE